MTAPAMDVLLTPRVMGGHETALFGWLRQAALSHGLQPRLLGLDSALAAAADATGLQAFVHGPTRDTRPLRALAAVPRGQPLLLAPGVLHAHAWLLAEALRRRHAVWVYVPMAHGAVAMGHRAARLKDAVLAPWLRRVRGYITIDARQQDLLREHWGITAPVHVLPNQVALDVPALPPPPPADVLRVAYVGRLDPWQKGLDWLAAQVQAGAPWTTRCRWLFQGMGAAEAMLLRLASALGPHRVQVRPHGPIETTLGDADVLLLPSRFEGLPLIALEASVRGRPVVASHDAGLQALLPAASQFDFGDAHGLARALASLATPQARLAAVDHAQARLPQLLQPAVYAENLRLLVQAWGQAGAQRD